MKTNSKWLRLIAWLRREFPTQKPIAVRSIRIHKDFFGYTSYMRSRFLICISKQEPFAMKVETLLHEWAHALTWFGAENHIDHPDEWGLQYAKVYRAFEEWDFGKGK